MIELYNADCYEKLKESGGHGYIIDDKLTDEDIDNIFNKKPEFKAQKFGVAPIWHRVLGGKL